MREKVVEQKRSTLRLAFAALARGCHVGWIGSMSKFVNKSFDLTMKKAEDTIRDVSPEEITGLLRRMSIDTKSRLVIAVDVLLTKGVGLTIRRGSSELQSKSSVQSLIAASWIMLK